MTVLATEKVRSRSYPRPNHDEVHYIHLSVLDSVIHFLRLTIVACLCLTEAGWGGSDFVEGDSCRRNLRLECGLTEWAWDARLLIMAAVL
jgi:hypothetical protein